MTRKVFHSFRYELDHWRVQQVKQMGVVEGQPLLNSNEWEQIKKGGCAAIRRWIDEQMKGKSCQIILIGQATTGRKWVDYEIRKAWADRKGVCGIYIHNLKDSDGNTVPKGRNPLDDIMLNGGGSLSSIVKTYDPPNLFWKSAYTSIEENISKLVEDAITIRAKYK